MKNKATTGLQVDVTLLEKWDVITEHGTAILRMHFRTVPEIQWSVARAYNQLLKQRMKAQALKLDVPRLSVSMERMGRRLPGWQQQRGRRPRCNRPRTG